MTNHHSQGLLLSILIPVYNEQAYLGRIVQKILNVPLPGGLRRELVMVNDASTDRTGEVMDALAKEYPDLIRVFHQDHNQGKGAAIQRAIREMTGDFAIFQDADLEYDPNDYTIVLTPLVEGYADVVYGSRFATRTMRRVLFYHHKLGNLFLTHLSNFTTGFDLTDMETCYKAFRSEILKSVPLRSCRFGIEPEITAKIAKRGLTLYEVPISYHGRRYSEGKKIGWKDGVSAIYTILKYWLIDDCWDAEHVRATRLLRTMEYSRNFCRQFQKMALPYLGTKIAEVDAGVGTIARGLPQRERLLLTESDDAYLNILRNFYEGNAVVEVASCPLFSEPIPSSIPTDNDTLILYNRLQQSSDPVVLLKRISSLLAENGTLLVAVPSRPFLFSQVDREMTNLRRYTKSQLQNELVQGGYQVEKIIPFNRTGFLLALWTKLTGAKEPNRFLMKVFDFTFLCFSRLGWLVPFPGANWLAVAKKVR